LIPQTELFYLFKWKSIDRKKIYKILLFFELKCWCQFLKRRLCYFHLRFLIDKMIVFELHMKNKIEFVENWNCF